MTNAGASAPSWSFDDKLIAYVQGNPQYFGGFNIGNLAPSSVWIARVEGGAPQRITDEQHLNTSPVWTPEGAVLYVSSLKGNRDIFLQKIGGDLKTRGESSRLTTGLNAHTISIDKTGSLLAYSVFIPSSNVWAVPIASHGRDMHQVTSGTQTIEAVSTSPDGKWLAYDSNRNGNSDIYKISVDGGEPEQLTHNGSDNFFPTWSPDGTQIGFHSLVNGNRDVFIMDANGGNLTQVTQRETRGACSDIRFQRQRAALSGAPRLRVCHNELQKDGRLRATSAECSLHFRMATGSCQPLIPDGCVQPALQGRTSGMATGPILSVCKPPNWPRSLRYQAASHGDLGSMHMSASAKRTAQLPYGASRLMEKAKSESSTLPIH